jgi:hypothetical protein
LAISLVDIRLRGSAVDCWETAKSLWGFSGE